MQRLCKDWVRVTEDLTDFSDSLASKDRDIEEYHVLCDKIEEKLEGRIHSDLITIMLSPMEQLMLDEVRDWLEQDE